jgi:hypothetical protein
MFSNSSRSPNDFDSPFDQNEKQSGALPLGEDNRTGVEFTDGMIMKSGENGGHKDEETTTLRSGKAQNVPNRTRSLLQKSGLTRTEQPVCPPSV